MKKENLLILLVVTFVAGFVVGAVSGIKFYSYQRVGTGPGMQDQKVQQGQQDMHPPVNSADIARAEDVVKADPKNLQALISLGNLYFDSDQYAKSIDAYERALAIDPNNPDVRTDLGIMYRKIKDYDRAVKEFREAARIDPKHANSRFNLGVVLQHDKKDLRGALTAWEDFLRLEPSGDRSVMAKAQIEELKQLLK